MKLYIITLFNPSNLGDQIVKIFSTRDNLDKWMEHAKLMDRELFGDQGRDVTQSYKIKEAELDNLDFIELYAEAKSLGAQVKPSKPQ